MVEFDVDMGYLLEARELDSVVLNDENGEHEPRVYVPERTCHEVLVDKHWRGCSECAYKWEFMYGIGKCERPNYCPDCGAKVVDE